MSWQNPELSYHFYKSLSVPLFIPENSGYLLAHKVLKHERNPVGTLALFIVCRFIRTTVPLFFVVMCFYLVPAMIWGPNSAELYEKFYEDMEKHWWLLLIQARNAMSGPGSIVLRHLWYISADFQLFIVALPILLLFKSKPRPAIFAFVALSLLGSSLTAWQMYDSGFDPFVYVTSKTFTAKTDMFSNVYVLPSFHGPCFFAGCICYYLVKRNRSINLSKVLQLTLWIVSLGCFLACIFVRYDWNRGMNSNEDWVKMLLAFLERPVWSIFLMWFIFACATENGGIIKEFLSWEAIVPMGRLTFGAYLTYFPIHYLVYHVSRERMAYNHFRLVTNCLGVAVWSYSLSFLLYLFSCAPVRNLEKALCGEEEVDEADTDYESDFNRSSHIKPLKSHGNVCTDTSSRDGNPIDKTEKSTRL